MKRTVYSVFALTVTLFIGQTSVHGQAPLGSEFTYQGQLKDGGIPADGDYDFVFRLFDAATDGLQVGSDFPVDDWPVSDGLFTVQVDFGDGAFNSAARWLEVAVRPWDSNDPHTVLSPRQPVTAAPVALYALDGLSSGGFWAADGDDIYNTNAGNVGVGTNTPAYQLHVSGDFRADSRTAVGNDAYIGLGGGPYPDYDRIHDFSHVITDFSSTPYWAPLMSTVTLDPTGDLTSGERIYGNSFEAHVAEGSDKDIESVVALYGGAVHKGSGQVVSLFGELVDSVSQGAGTVVHNWGLVAEAGGGFGSTGDITNNIGIGILTGHWGDAGGVQTNQGLLVRTPDSTQPIDVNYGIYLEDQNAAQTMNYAIYNAGGDTYLNGALDATGDVHGCERVAFGNNAAFGTGGTWYPDWPRVFDFSHTISTDFSLAPAWTPVRSFITVDPTGGGDEEIYSHDFEIFVPHANTEDINFLQGPTLGAMHYGTGNIYRFVGGVALCEDHGGGTADYQTGFAAQSIVWEGTGTIGENRGVEIWTGHYGSAGSIATNIGLWIATPQNRQPLTDHYGIYLEDQNVAVNDSYAIYVAGGDSYFNGDLEVTGTVSKSGGSFKIDHPLDPENKYLYHSFVESPDMMNIYNGNVVTDDDGRAWVQLPDYFAALNRDFRYQLTVLGQFAQAIVEREIENGGFQIRTDKPGVKVSWQVTGIRKDPWAERNRIPVEEDKLPDDQGKYLHPELYGQPAEMGVHYRQPRPSMAYERDRDSQRVAP